ncbi:hypothetical protein OIO90_000256 [Microbotryomycetes sp. JL221]|nr:hypothetical protein OIO90_000256 [Microbotryomycetes sp. JL221]
MLTQLARTPSEVQLTRLTLDLKLARLSDEDLIASLPSIGQGELESQEHHFAQLANKALLHLATPPSGHIYSPCSVSPVPDALENSNPFFARKMYHDSDLKWARPTPPPSSHFEPSSSASSHVDDYFFSPPLSTAPSSTSEGVTTPPLALAQALEAKDADARSTSTTDESRPASPRPCLALRRGCVMQLELPPAPDFELEMQQRQAAKARSQHQQDLAQSPVSGFFLNNSQHGVLKSNFAGVKLAKPVTKVELSSPASSAETPSIHDMRTLPLRRKRRDHGFAF